MGVPVATPGRGKAAGRDKRIGQSSPVQGSSAGTVTGGSIMGVMMQGLHEVSVVPSLEGDQTTSGIELVPAAGMMKSPAKSQASRDNTLPNSDISILIPTDPHPDLVDAMGSSEKIPMPVKDSNTKESLEITASASSRAIAAVGLEASCSEVRKDLRGVAHIPISCMQGIQEADEILCNQGVQEVVNQMPAMLGLHGSTMAVTEELGSEDPGISLEDSVQDEGCSGIPFRIFLIMNPSIFYWNIRGIANLVSRRSLRRHVKNNNVDFLAIAEPMVPMDRADSVRAYLDQYITMSVAKDDRVLLVTVVKSMNTVELYWAQKARMQWLDDGDKNTAFYHAVVKGTRRRNHIHRLKVAWKAPGVRIKRWWRTAEFLLQGKKHMLHHVYRESNQVVDSFANFVVSSKAMASTATEVADAGAPRRSYAQIIAATKPPPLINIGIKPPSFTDAGEPTVFFSQDEDAADMNVDVANGSQAQDPQSRLKKTWIKNILALQIGILQCSMILFNRFHKFLHVRNLHGMHALHDMDGLQMMVVLPPAAGGEPRVPPEKSFTREDRMPESIPST
ncbi:hypothetical protein Taro_055912, partial [Colocasia esculenta]|nr:hypothetical protein [Colocasia esculenta]